MWLGWLPNQGGGCAGESLYYVVGNKCFFFASQVWVHVYARNFLQVRNFAKNAVFTLE